MHDSYADVELHPYGKFTLISYLDVANAAYAHAAALGEWAIAHEIADGVVCRQGERRSGAWLLSKATSLAKMGQPGLAKELLIKNVIPGRPSEVNRLLDELRDAPPGPVATKQPMPTTTRTDTLKVVGDADAPPLTAERVYRRIERTSWGPDRNFIGNWKGTLLLDRRRLVHLPHQMQVFPKSSRDLMPGDVHDFFGVKRRLLDPEEIADAEHGERVGDLLAKVGAEGLSLMFDEIASMTVEIYSLTLTDHEGAGHRFFMNPLRAALLRRWIRSSRTRGVDRGGRGR